MKSLFIMTVFAGLLSSSYCLAEESSQIKTSNYISIPKTSYMSLKLGYADVKTNESIYYTTFDGSNADDASKKIADGGLSGSLSIGRIFGFFRPELELSFAYMNMKNKIKDEVVVGTVNESIFVGIGNIEHKSKFNNYSLMLNFLFDIPTGTAFTPYLGFGGGYGYNKLTLNQEGKAKSILNNTIAKLDAETDVSKFSLTYQAMVGFIYKTKENLEFDIGYKYTDYGEIGNVYIDDTEKMKAKANIISFGMRAPF